MTRIIGVDSSLTSAGIAVLNYDPTTGLDVTTTVVRSTGKSSDPTVTRAKRIIKQRNGILEHCTGADLVVIEAPAYASKTRFQHEISWLWGAVYTGLVHMNIPVIDIPPTQLKGFVLGKGGGPGTDKVAVAAAMTRMWTDQDMRYDDEFDALGLATMAAVHYRWPVPFNVLERHKTPLAKIVWPQHIPKQERP